MSNNAIFLGKRGAVMAGLWLCLGSAQAYESLENFPQDKTPQVIGKKVAEDLLGRKFMLSRFSKESPSIHYAEICTAYGAIKFADLTKDTDLLQKLEKRYLPIVEDKNSTLIPNGFHGDYTVFAMVPFELYRLRGDKRFLDLGVKMVDEQWDKKNLSEDGMTKQARWWIDDCYMIPAVDALATRVTGNQTHVNNGAFFLNAYCSKLQDKTGLLPHTDKVPHYWGRGDGWVAAGLVEVLITLPKDNKFYDSLMADYKKLMAALLPLQAESGLWRQLLDDPDAWEETSCTGMFTYAYITGIKKGWLDEKTYGSAARKGWLALTNMMDEKGLIKDVCIGTNEGEGKEAYLGRKRVKGDFHGQAPVLWCANALLD